LHHSQISQAAAAPHSSSSSTSSDPHDPANNTAALAAAVAAAAAAVDDDRMDTQSEMSTVTNYSLAGDKRRIARAGRAIRTRKLPLQRSAAAEHSNVAYVQQQVQRNVTQHVGRAATDGEELGGDGRRIHRAARLLRDKRRTDAGLDNVQPGAVNLGHRNLLDVAASVRRKASALTDQQQQALAGQRVDEHNAAAAAAQQQQAQYLRAQHMQQQAHAAAAAVEPEETNFIARCLNTGACSGCWSSLKESGMLSGVVDAVESLFDSTNEKTAIREMTGGVVVPPVFDARAVSAAITKFAPDAVLSTTVRRTDLLRPDIRIVHPLVRLHVVDAVSGAYLAKTSVLKAVSGAGEAQRTQPVEYLRPLLTLPSDLLATGAFVPSWNEELVYNEPLVHFLRPNVLFLFELVDFGPRIDPDAYPNGDFPIAWAFLRPLSGSGHPNLGERRLQLRTYASKRPRMHRDNTPDVYFEWVYQKNVKKHLYPSSLHVYLGGVSLPASRVVAGVRPLFPTDGEQGRVGFMAMRRQLAEREAMDSHATSRMGDGIAGPDGVIVGGAASAASALAGPSNMRVRAIKRRRQAHGESRVPNAELHEITAGANGVFCIAFSPNGRLLAAACGENLTFAIKLFETETGVHVFTYSGHRDIVYELAWAGNGTELVSASSDTTAKVWNTDLTNLETAIHPRHTANLQHTSYVYTVKYHPIGALAARGGIGGGLAAAEASTSSPLIFTGCYDGIIRVWDRQTQTVVVGLHQHATHVQCIEFTPNGQKFFSGDANGVIKVWTDRAIMQTFLSGGAGRTAAEMGGVQMDWRERFVCARTITHPHFAGSLINSLRYHPQPERLAVYARNNHIYSIELLGNKVRKQMSIKNANHLLTLDYSPCGTKLVAGGEDGRAYFFDVYSGALLTTLEFGFQLPLCGVSWHPTEHAVAFCSYGGNANVDYPIYVWEYDSHVHSQLVQLRKQRERDEKNNTVVPTYEIGEGIRARGASLSSGSSSSSASSSAMSRDARARKRVHFGKR
jgi:jouberin